jgi:hypothetical protein
MEQTNKQTTFSPFEGGFVKNRSNKKHAVMHVLLSVALVVQKAGGGVIRSIVIASAIHRVSRRG